MDAEQLIAFLKQNLKLTIDKTYNAVMQSATVSVKLSLCGEEIAKDEVII